MLESGECRVVFPPRARREAQALLDGFALRRAHAARWLGVEPRGRPELHLVEGFREMRARAGERVPKWALAVTRRDDRIVFRLDRVNRAPANSLELVLAHEVVHQVLTHLGGAPLPRWFEEGLCVYNAGVPYLEADYTVERLAAAGNLPAFADLDADFRKDERTAAHAYRAGHSAVTFFLQRFGAGDLRRLLQLVGEGREFAQAFREATGRDIESFESEWRESVTPEVPYLVFILLENLELTLFFFGALLVFGGYVHRRLKRERALQSLGE